MLEQEIKGVDRVIIQVDAKQQVPLVYSALKSAYHLSEAWPITSYPPTSYNPGGFTSGGLFAGNCNLEILFVPMSGPIRRLFSKRSPRISAVSFEPTMPLEELMSVLDRYPLPHTGILEYKIHPMRLLKRQIHVLGRSRLDLAFAQDLAILHQMVFIETEPFFRLGKLKDVFAQWVLHQLLELGYKAQEKPLFFFTRYNDLYLNPDLPKPVENALQQIHLNPLPIDMSHPMLTFAPDKTRGIYGLEFANGFLHIDQLSSIISA